MTSFSNNTLINYETDLLSKNSKKQIKIEIDDFQYRLIFNYLPNVDAVIIEKNRKILEKKLFKKNRSTEFQNEISHILKIDNKNYLSSPIHYKKGLNVIKIIRKVLIN